MAFSTSPKKSKTAKAGRDFDLISDMPDIVIDKILKRLPVTMVAQTSLLSRKWRLNWLSHRYLVFNAAFWDNHRKDGKIDWEKCSSIINNIFLHHIGEIYKFHLAVPECAPAGSVNISQWVSFLSRSCIKKMTLFNCFHRVPLPSHVYHCKELRQLWLGCFQLNPPPYDFKGFGHLQSIHLTEIVFEHDVLGDLIRNSPQLTLLHLHNCSGTNHLVIEAPSIQSLIIGGETELWSPQSLGFKNVRSLTNLCLRLNRNVENSLASETVLSILSLINSNNIEVIVFNGKFCKFLAAGGITKSFPLAFNCLQSLSLLNLDLSDFDIFSCTLGLLQSSPFVKELLISVNSTDREVQHKSENCDDNFKLSKLLNVELEGITGSSTELKLIEYLLAMSMVLEKMFLNFGAIDAETERKILRQVVQFPRASPKAQLICLDK